MSVLSLRSVKSQDFKGGSHLGLQTMARNEGLVLKAAKDPSACGSACTGLSVNSCSAPHEEVCLKPSFLICKMGILVVVYLTGL